MSSSSSTSSSSTSTTTSLRVLVSIVISLFVFLLRDSKGNTSIPSARLTVAINKSKEWTTTLGQVTSLVNPLLAEVDFPSSDRSKNLCASSGYTFLLLSG